MVSELLSDAYGNDLDALDAYTGAVAEQDDDGSTLFFGPLLRVGATRSKNAP